MKRRVLRSTKLTIDDFDQDFREQLENRFMAVEAMKVDATRAERKAAAAHNTAIARRAEATNAELELLEFASVHRDEIAQERVWFVFRQDGKLTFESPFTEKDVRNAMRLQKEQMNKAVENLDSDNDQLYEGEEEDQD